MSYFTPLHNFPGFCRKREIEVPGVGDLPCLDFLNNPTVPILEFSLGWESADLHKVVSSRAQGSRTLVFCCTVVGAFKTKCIFLFCPYTTQRAINVMWSHIMAHSFDRALLGVLITATSARKLWFGTARGILEWPVFSMLVPWWMKFEVWLVITLSQSLFSF